jgi:Ran GTPase-activating protein (RanGAP) involved in mRNA processing and transport
LSNNYLNWLSADEFVDVIQALPVGLKSLGLRSNNLDKYSASDLIKILKALPQNLASLNLNYNKLGEKFSAIELIEILQALPQNLTSLCFEGNQLGNFSHQEKIQILTSLPKNLNHLNLNNNFFMHLTGNELSEIFEVLPKNLASLAWCENLLYRFSAYELDTAFSKLSANNLTSLFLSANKLKDNQVNALLDFLAHSKITTLELKTTWMETQENSYQGGLSEKTSNEIEMILRNNQNKALLNADPDGSGIYGLQALCGRAITLFQVPCGIENTPLSCLRIIDESKQMVETQGIKLGKY